MKKQKNKKITVMIDADFQSQMQNTSEEFGIEWSEKIRDFVSNEIKFMRQNNEDSYKMWVQRRLRNR